MKHSVYFLLLLAACGLTNCQRIPYAYYQRTPNTVLSTVSTPTPSSAKTPPLASPRLSTMEASAKPTSGYHAARTVVLPAGTQISAQLIQSVNSQSVQSGQQIPVRVITDVSVKKVRVIKAGASGMAIVQTVEKGKVPTVSISLSNIQAVDGQQVAVSGGQIQAQGKKGGIPVWAIIGTILLFPLGALLLLVRKPSIPAEINAGTTLNGTTVSETEVDNDSK